MTNHTESPADGPVRWKSLSGRGIVLRIIAVVLLVAVVFHSLQTAGVIRMSVVDTIMGSLFAVIGIIAGLMAAGQRKKGNVAAAFLGYRIAVWCLFLALVQALAYQNDRERERIDDEIKRRFDLEKDPKAHRDPPFPRNPRRQSSSSLSPFRCGNTNAARTGAGIGESAPFTERQITSLNKRSSA